MNRYQSLASILFIFFILFIIAGLIIGEISFGIAVFIPFLIGSGIYAFLGFFCLILAIILYMIGFVRSEPSQHPPPYDSYEPDSRKHVVKTGGVILIGPIPIVFGSNWKITVFMIMVAILFFLLLYIYFYLM